MVVQVRDDSKEDYILYWVILEFLLFLIVSLQLATKFRTLFFIDQGGFCVPDVLGAKGGDTHVHGIKSSLRGLRACVCVCVCVCVVE